MKNYSEDIFTKPKLYFDKNNQLRISSWDLSSVAERIRRLNEDDDFYNFYSNKIKNENTFEKVNNNFLVSLKKMIEKVAFMIEIEMTSISHYIPNVFVV